MIKTIGNIEQDHPYFSQLILFFDALIQELPFHNHLNDAIKAIDIDPISFQIMFPKGNQDINHSLIDYLNFKTTEFFKESDIKGVKLIFTTLIMYQITFKTHMIDNFKKFMCLNFFKLSPLTHSKHLFSLIDHLWILAGDQSTDYNYYSKRILLGKIYIQTMLYAASDKSPNYQDTRTYLMRNFDTIKTIETFKKKLPNMSNIEENIARFLGKLRYK